MGAIQGALGGAAAGYGLYKDLSGMMNSQTQSPQNFQYQA
jgi:hypothetical protein